MTLEDPFFVVKDEVSKALLKTRALYGRYVELEDGQQSFLNGSEEAVWVNNELRNSLRSIEWDLEDLEETLTIVEKNPKKFRIDNVELSARKDFIGTTRTEVTIMKERLQMNKDRDHDKTASQPLIEHSTALESPEHYVQGYLQHHCGGNSSNNKYSYTRLENNADSPDTDLQQKALLGGQNLGLDRIASTMGNLKVVSTHINTELDEQQVMLDAFGHDVETTDPKLDTGVRKLSRIFLMTTDRRQWVAIGVLSVLTVLVLFLLFTL